MRSVKQRKHKRNNSLRQYKKKKSRKVSLIKKRKNKKMRGGSINTVFGGTINPLLNKNDFNIQDDEYDDTIEDDNTVTNPLLGTNFNTTNDDLNTVVDPPKNNNFSKFNSVINPLLGKISNPNDPNDPNDPNEYNSLNQSKGKSSFLKNLSKNIPKIGNNKTNEIREYDGNTTEKNDDNDTLLNKPKGSFFEGINKQIKKTGQNMKTLKPRISPDFSNFTRKLNPQSLNNRYSKLDDKNGENINSLSDKNGQEDNISLGNTTKVDSTVINPLLGDKYDDIDPEENDDSTINPLLMNNMPINVEKPSPENIEDINVIMNDTPVVNNKETSTSKITELAESQQKIAELRDEILRIRKQNDKNTLLYDTELKNLNKKIEELKNDNNLLNTKITANEKKNDENQRESEEIINKTKSEKELSLNQLTETHNKEIQSKTEEKEQLKTQITNLTTDIQNITKERDALQTEIMTNLLKTQNKIVVSLDKEPFYKDICKNIKNIIINAHFLDMLFDEILKSYPQPNIQETKANQLSPADKERQLKIKGMKDKIATARDFLYTFLQDLVAKLNLDSGVLIGVQPIDSASKTALGSNMAAYLFAASFFPLIGGKSKGKGKTLKSLGLRNKKLTKSQRSMIMKGGIDSQDKPKLEDLITKVIADICQQMELTENLLKYIPNASLEMNAFNLSLIEFKTVYQERKGSNKMEIEPVTNFLVPYKESPSDNEYINQIKKDIEIFLRERQEKMRQTDAKLNEIGSTNLR